MYILVIHKFAMYITQHCSFNFGMYWGMILLVELVPKQDLYCNVFQDNASSNATHTHD